MLGSLKEKIKGIVQCGANSIINSDMVLGAVNNISGRYAIIHSITLSDYGFEIQAQLNGSDDVFAVSAKGLFIADDNSYFTISSFQSDIQWLNNVLCDFIAGSKIEVPENHRSAVSMLKKFI